MDLVIVLEGEHDLIKGGLEVEGDETDRQVLDLNHIVYLCHALYFLGGSLEVSAFELQHY